MAGGVLAAVIGTVFGLLWVGMLLSARSEFRDTPGGGPPIGFALIGVLVIIGAVAGGGYMVNRAHQYDAAKQRYEQRRVEAAKRADAPPSPPE